MGLLDSLLGGALGAGALQLVEKVIQQHGGVQGLVQNFEQNGLGAIAQSWVGNGANQAVTPAQVHQALGADTVTNLAAQAGIDPQALLAQLAAHLPGAIDHLTPTGAITS